MLQVTDNRNLAIAMWAECAMRERMTGMPATPADFQRLWDECPSQQEWLDRAEMVRRCFRRLGKFWR